jgi:hypothetical protein
METHFHPPSDPFGPAFPSLPIVTPDAPRRSDREKYGALFYLGTAGLVVLASLLGWFSWGAWSLRTVWTNIYILHDGHRQEAERVQAAYALGRDPRVNPRQLWDIALRKPLPPLARYVVAEGLTAEAVSADPRGFGAAVARSEGWPGWLRLLMTRPIAYAAALGEPVPHDWLAELARNPEPALALWASYALATSREGDKDAAAVLRRAAATDGQNRSLAEYLLAALDAEKTADRLKALDAATLWLRDHHPEAATLWNGWEVRGNQLVRREVSISGPR